MRPLLLTLVLTTAAAAQDVHLRVRPGAPAVTTEDATLFPSIQNAIDHHPLPGPLGGRIIIEVDPGTYRERILVTRNHPNITLLGTGTRPEDTVITNALNASTAGGTFFSQTVEIEGDAFEAANLTIENAAPYPTPNGSGAVAAAIRSDRAVFRHVRFLSHQDTLFADFGRQLYLDCFISGSADYIFGNATAVFQNTELNSTGPGYITAQSRTAPTQATGFVFLNSRVTSAAAIPATAANNIIGLGHPWRPFARVVFISTLLPENLMRTGWNNWNKPSNQSTAFFAEFNSTGPGASPATRAPWAHRLTEPETEPYLPATFLAGPDHWDPETAAAKLP